MKAIVFEFKQSNKTLLSTVLESDVINSISRVLEYKDGNDWGYQRKENPNHVSEIASYIKDNDFLFPNSVILALSEKEFIGLKKDKINSTDNIYEIDLKGLDFHIVDGQHRLAGIKKSAKNVPLNVVILIIPEKSKHIELDIFTTINSKAKRIPTDLAELAKYKYVLLSDKKSLESIEKNIDYVAMKIAIDLNNTNDTSSLWKNAIKIDINSEKNIGSVGVSAFKKSIRDLVKQLLENEKNQNSLTIEELDKLASDLIGTINNCWNICYKKWSFCFTENPDNTISALKDYYIQKTLGVSSIHGLLKELYDNDLSQLESDFKTIILSSKVTSDDWAVGGVMSGYSSESGFKKIREFIKNNYSLK